MHPAVAATATATAAAKNLAAFAFWFPFRMHSSNAFIIYQASTVQHSTAVVTCNVQRATGNRRLEATQFNSADSCCSCQLSRRRHLWTSPTLPCPHSCPTPTAALADAAHVAYYLMPLTGSRQRQRQQQFSDGNCWRLLSEDRRKTWHSASYSCHMHPYQGAGAVAINNAICKSLLRSCDSW